MAEATAAEKSEPIKRRDRKPGRRASAARAVGSSPGRPKGSKLDPFRSVIGSIPDRDVAAKAGMSVEAVRLYRKKNQIELQPGARLKRGRKPKSATPGLAPNAASQRSATARIAMRPGPRRRISKLDPYLDMLGKVPDGQIAAEAGTTPENVRAYRVRHNIPATWRQEGEESAPAPKRGRGRPPGPARRESARPRNNPSGQQGYSVHVLVGTATHEYMVIAADISSAAVQAQATIRGRHPNGVITAIRHLAAALL